MKLVRIFNDNVYPLVEIFKGNEVHIKAKDYWRDEKGSVKELDIFEASEFKGQYHPGPIDTNGMMLKDPQYFKKIKLEEVANSDKKVMETHTFKCMVTGCRHVSPSPEELEAHNKVRHGNQPVSQGTADGPLGMDPSANETRPVFTQNVASHGKEDAPSTRRKGA